MGFSLFMLLVYFIDGRFHFLTLSSPVTRRFRVTGLSIAIRCWKTPAKVLLHPVRAVDGIIHSRLQSERIAREEFWAIHHHRRDYVGTGVEVILTKKGRVCYIPTRA